MFEKFRLKRAKKHDAKRLARLFSTISSSIPKSDILSWIKKDEVFVLKHKKKIKGAFSYATLGIAGLFGIIYIRKLAVSKDMRGKGVGSFLLRSVKQLSKKTGTALFFLFSLKQAIKFYEKNKLKRFGRFFWWKEENDK